MNAVEIEEAVSQLAAQPFEAAEFPFQFLESYDNKATTIKRLRKGTTNKSKIAGGVLQRSNIHLAVCAPGTVAATLDQLRDAPETTRGKAKFILATDGRDLEAEHLTSGETLACAHADLGEHFAFFFELAGISSVKEIRESSFDIKATGRLNKLYLELLRANPDWATAERRPELNHFMARLIFCFFAEDTSIFAGDNLFTGTVQQMSDPDAANTHEIIAALFRAMDIPPAERPAQNVRPWANKFPYVNGELFSGATDCPRFTKIARSYLLHVGNLDWKRINPDIFGSMIQAVADEDERGSLGMHYTSVPNILKVLNPLFLDELRDRLTEADDNARKLLNLRKRLARIRVFDPACGSGNFLVIAYKQLRELEHQINQLRGEANRPTDIPLTNFRGIEIKGFSAEVARLALIIAEYQCDVLYRGEQLALAEFLPLDSENWIKQGNALRMDWLAVCPPTGREAREPIGDLFGTPQQAAMEFENEGGETYICGNPPFSGARKQTSEQKKDLEVVFANHFKNWKRVDYVGAWFYKAALYCKTTTARFAFVATNSFCQGQQVPLTWAKILSLGYKVRFAYTSFIWKNLASHNAGVTVIIAGLDLSNEGSRYLYTEDSKKEVEYISPYLLPNDVQIVNAARNPLFTDISMSLGIYYSKSAGLILSTEEKTEILSSGIPDKFVKKFLGSNEYIKGLERHCLWISDSQLEEAMNYPKIKNRIQSVKIDRLETTDKAVNKLALRPHQFREYRGTERVKIFIPIVSSESRDYFPSGLVDDSIIPTNKAFYIPNGPVWTIGIISSKLHLIWIGTICGRLRSDFSYSNTLGWNTFPVPKLTTKNKQDLTRCAEDILLARERHFPATIAELYDPDKMPEDLRRAHDRNDEVLERIYIGRRFKNDTERLERLFALYTKMTAPEKTPAQ